MTNIIILMVQTILFSDLYPAKFLDTSTKSFHVYLYTIFFQGE